MRARAKRAGYNELLTPEQQFDLEPRTHESWDLEGELSETQIPTEFGTVTLVLVDGQEADPATVQRLPEVT